MTLNYYKSEFSRNFALLRIFWEATMAQQFCCIVSEGIVAH